MSSVEEEWDLEWDFLWLRSKVHSDSKYHNNRLINHSIPIGCSNNCLGTGYLVHTPQYVSGNLDLV